MLGQSACVVLSLGRINVYIAQLLKGEIIPCEIAYILGYNWDLLPPILNISLFRDFNTDYIRMYIDVF